MQNFVVEKSEENLKIAKEDHKISNDITSKIKSKDIFLNKIIILEQKGNQKAFTRYFTSKINNHFNEDPFKPLGYYYSKDPDFMDNFQSDLNENFKPPEVSFKEALRKATDSYKNGAHIMRKKKMIKNHY